MAQQEAPANNDADIDVGGMANALNRCPHAANSVDVPAHSQMGDLLHSITNPSCSVNNCDQTECWFCLKCHRLFCGRYANQHMIAHKDESASHCVAMSVGDLSFWCYGCDSYINHLTIQPIFEVYAMAHIAKFGEAIPDQIMQDTNFAVNDNANTADNDEETLKKKKEKKDDDGDNAMDEYDTFMNDQQAGNESDYLDYSVNDEAFDALMKQVCDDEDSKASVQWDETNNAPNIAPILQQLHHRKLFVGPLPTENDQNNEDDQPMYRLFRMSRGGLTEYSLFEKIASSLKVKYIRAAIDHNVQLDRAIGAVVGMGIGDATGAPLEFLPCVDDHKKSYFRMKGPRRWVNEQNAFNLKRGQWTDDASMGLCMADSLIVNQQYNGSDIRIRFWNWWNNGYCNAFRFNPDQFKSSVGLGGNISKSIFSMQHGQIPTPQFITNTSKDDSGNGSLMRLAPIPVFFCHFHETKQMMDVALAFAKESSFTTHPGFIAAEACALMSYIIIKAINRPPPTVAVNDTANDVEEKKEENDTNAKPQENVQEFLENITGEYLKQMQRERSDTQNTLKELLKSKEYNAIKNSIQQKKAEKTSKYDEEEEDDDDMYEPAAIADKEVHSKWIQLQNQVNLLQRQIVAKQFIIKLIQSAEPDDSTERCWNWKSKYGQLGIDLAMVNRGNSYNGYPNTQGYFGSYCMDGLAMGLHALYNSTSFGDAVMKAVNMLGDADSTGSIAGQMAGAWYGFKDVFYDTHKQRFLFKQLSKWDDYEFGLRAILLYVIGAEFAKKGKEKLKQHELQQKEKVQGLQNEANDTQTGD
eukprot:CAMPEP_0197048228 /NCGR_PEP_ID=MMETSP1384-20130603/23624_1 /TAXON_ID=29189 /ORGANISM="Ammonia sp." /LENGTH=807 /DNA_ID=CAMNT_0042480331 /DNA_START=29 /DNA_END=2452 /DNA_ORIENTATION=-